MNVTTRPVIVFIHVIPNFASNFKWSRSATFDPGAIRRRRGPRCSSGLKLERHCLPQFRAQLNTHNASHSLTNSYCCSVWPIWIVFWNLSFYGCLVVILIDCLGILAVVIPRTFTIQGKWVEVAVGVLSMYLAIQGLLAVILSIFRG